MFGGAPFGSLPAGGAPYVGPLLVEASGSMVGLAAIVPSTGALSSSGGVMRGTGALTGAMAALRMASGFMSVQGLFAPGLVALRQSSATLGGTGALLGRAASVYNSSGRMVGEWKLFGAQLRAYDQLFPDQAVDNYTVQIGRRLYRWKANTGRWHPAGPAPV